MAKTAESSSPALLVREIRTKILQDAIDSSIVIGGIVRNKISDAMLEFEFVDDINNDFCLIFPRVKTFQLSNRK